MLYAQLRLCFRLGCVSAGGCAWALCPHLGSLPAMAQAADLKLAVISSRDGAQLDVARADEVDLRFSSAVETQALAFGSRAEAGQHLRLLRRSYDADPALWLALAEVDLLCFLQPGCSIVALVDEEKTVVAVACLKERVEDSTAREAAFAALFAPMRSLVSPEALEEYDRSVRSISVRIPTLQMCCRSSALCLKAFGDARPANVREITWLAVRPSHQRCGIGARMLAALRAQAFADGRVLSVYTSPDAHVGWYERNGFEQVAAIRPAPGMHTRLLVARI